ncbi:MAG: aminoglycoside phosphotransferase family protein [Chloroflexi bacterium]|nr:aminoglycoside phosphotransferase family protein [Chloroflexota bacterium]
MTAEAGRVNIEDPAALLGYLRDQALIAPGEAPRFRNLAGGVSNRTALVQRDAGDDWVLKQALAKLRVEVDWFSAPERIQREAAGLRWLGEIIPGHVPQFVFADEKQHILGMSAVPQPHQNWKTALLAGKTSVDQARAFGRLLATIHSAGVRIPELSEEFADRRFFEELRLEPYYSYAGSQVAQARSFMAQLIEDTRDRRLALTHGDYSPKNVLIAGGKLILLDFEVIHFGDPAFDIGFSFAHFLAKAYYLPRARRALLEMARAYWRAYVQSLTPQLRAPVAERAPRHSLACLLARMAGRSPLEYLDQRQRSELTGVALDLMNREPKDMPDLIQQYEARLGQACE